ncbi:DgyrCDS5957 [Dimorphilus gyrociliatus]|uniref:DgyrCDS5957 n=1 Tax=Dimorphilus gyrociliatus TaxID=2664684 RepID=A0A7I8VLH9_9ANNE|nr:DgyrCDS5957 [Dimorphilus gyrociliatus]
MFRLEISGIKDEVRINIGGDLTEVLSYRLADGNLHRLALSFSPNHVEMRVNCSVVYRRPTSFSSLISIDNSNYPNLRVAQYFKGYLKEMIIVSGSNGYSIQCPNSNIPCPSCEQFHNLVELTKRMEQRIEELEKRLTSAESTLKWVKETESGKYCLHNGKQYRNLEKFHDKQCLGYECRNGFVKRLNLREVCPKLENCLYGTYRGPSDCCERCSKHCPVKSGFAHRFEGETWTTIRSNVCEKWECSNGMRISRTKREHCPVKLKCSNPVWVPNSCCRRYCKKDACKAAGCSRNAVCHIHLGEAQCKCKKGYRGDGRRCIDINECETYEKCPYPHSCLNIPGSYQCNCATGYDNRHGQCVDIRSCKEDSQCNSNAKCINKVCECLPGYDGDGRMCRPICTEDCRNGGLCVGWNTCKCKKGFNGRLCGKDIDECLQRSSICGKNSLCKNTFGSYECNCKIGFERQKSNKECVDIDECKTKSPCPFGTRCVNREGSFECKAEGSNFKGCMDEGLYHNHTDKWKREESCRTMTCINGTIQSRYDECQCGKDTRNCCKSQCSRKEKICLDEHGIRRPSRLEWKNNCKICQCFIFLFKYA